MKISVQDVYNDYKKVLKQNNMWHHQIHIQHFEEYPKADNITFDDEETRNFLADYFANQI